MDARAGQAVELDRLTTEQMTDFTREHSDYLVQRFSRLFTEKREKEFYYYTFMEDDMLRHITFNRALPLVTAPFDITEEATEQTTYLLGLVNQTLKPLGNQAEHRFVVERASVVGACPESELAYAGVVKTLEGKTEVGRVEEASHGGNPISIIVDDELRPLFLKKSVKAATAMNLQPISVNGIYFPTGMVMTASIGNFGPDRIVDVLSTSPTNPHQKHEFRYRRQGYENILEETELADGSPLRVIQNAQPKVNIVRQSMLTSEDPAHRRAIMTFEEGKPASSLHPSIEEEFSLARMQAAVASTLRELGIN